MKEIKTISFIVLMLVIVSATAVAQSSMSFRISSYGRGSRNFSLGYSSFGDYGYGGYGRNSFYGSFSSYGRYPRYSSYSYSHYQPRPYYRSYMPYYRPIYQQRYYQPVVIFRPAPIVRTITQPAVRQVVVQARRSEEVRNRKEKFLQMLKGEKEERIEAIKNLAGFSFDKKVEVALTEILLTDPDPEIRLAVAESLGKTNNKAFLAALEAAKKDTDDGVSQEADASIRKLK